MLSHKRPTRWVMVLVCAAIVTSTRIASAATAPTVTAEPSALDYGVVRPGSEQTKTMSVTNTGSKPVKIDSVEVECKQCTRVSFRPTELAPGKSVQVPIVFAPPSKEMGPVDRSVKFLTNNPDEPVLSVAVRAFVTEVAGLSPAKFAIVKPQTAGKKLREEIEIVNVSDQPLKMLYATSPLNGPRISVAVDPVAAGGRGKLNVEWTLPEQPGDYTGTAVIYLDHPKLHKLTLPYSASVQGVGSGGASGKPAPATRPAEKTGDGSQKKSKPPQAKSPIAPRAVAQPPERNNATAGVTAPATQPKLVRLELKDGLTLRDFVDVIASRLQLNLVYDEAALNVPVAVRLAKPVEEDALLPLLKSVLQAKGMALVSTERPEFWRIVAVKEAPPAAGLTQAHGGKAAVEGPNQIVTEVITPTRAEVNTLATVLKGFATAGSGQVTAVPDANLLIVTDYATQVDRLRGLVRMIDQGGQEDDFAVAQVPVRAAEVGPLADRISRLLTQLDQARGAKPRAAQLYLSADPESRQIVMVGRSSEFPHVREMIDRFDTAPGFTRAVYRFEGEQSTRTIAAIRQVLGADAETLAPDGSRRVAVVGAAVSVAATEGQHQQIQSLLHDADAERGQDADEMVLKVYRVKNRDAAEIESTMSRLIGFGGRGAASDIGRRPASPFSSDTSLTETGVRKVEGLAQALGTGARDSGTAAAPSSAASGLKPTTRPSLASRNVPPPNRTEGLESGGGEAPYNIALDVGTNSLLIAATPRLHRRIRELIEQLDQRQAQVLLEVMLVSVSDTNTFSYAVEAAMETTIRGGIGDLGSNFGIGQGPINGRTLNIGPGFNAAILSPGKFSVFVRALAETNEARVLSLPQVLALDNKPALVSSVQQQPFTSINSGNAVATTSFGGFAEAGTTLEITPHIAPADYLNMEYRLEVSSFTGNSSSASVPPPRRSDSISSFVSVPDGHTVILGGLRSDTRSKSVSKIPGFGDIPILGILGRSENHAAGDSTFYIFVRPSILRASKFEDLKALSELPKEQVRLPADYPPSAPQYVSE